MPLQKRKAPETLPGVNSAVDCQTPAEPSAPASALPAPPDVEDGDDEADHPHDVTWDAVAGQGGGGIAAWRTPRSGWAVVLERVALAFERPWNRLTATTQLNPLYQTGPIAFFLLIIVGLTGFYLFLFFQYGFDASYDAVATRIEGQFIGRAMRALHRYASGALVITTLLHAYRTLFMERFRGPRWVAWVTGFAMLLLLWLGGVTGYWLVWDARAQLIAEAFGRFLAPFEWLSAAYTVALRTAALSGTSWPIFLILFAVHLLSFLVVGGFFWLHIMRLKRARWAPDVVWVVGIGLVVVLISLFFPAGMLPQADFARLPEQVDLDPLFLFYLPFARLPAFAPPLLWGGLALGAAGLAALPWLARGKRPSPPTVNILKERCTGCTKCALDCPYGAIRMVERHDGKPHKYIAIEDPGLCVSCGICVGSCDGVAVTLGDSPPELLWETVAVQLALARARAPVGGPRVIFTCERHAAHGARPFLTASTPRPAALSDPAVEIIGVPCVGALPPALLTRTLDAGAAHVQVIGCPPGDCRNREGNLWTEQRLVRERAPRLRRAYANAPITAVWAPPDAFARAAGAPPAFPQADGRPDFLAARRLLTDLGWRNFGAAFGLLALVFALQIVFTRLPYTPFPDRPAVLQVAWSDLALPLRPNAAGMGTDVTLRLTVDETALLEERYATAELLARRASPLAVARQLEPGPYAVRLTLSDPGRHRTLILFAQRLDLAPGQIFQIGSEPWAAEGCYNRRCR